MSGKTLLRSGNAAPAPAALTALALAGESEGTGRCQTFAESTKGAAKILFGIFYGVCLFNLKKSSLKILEFGRAVESATNWVRGHWPALDESTTF